jgi:putative ABC transport system permease protein
MRSFWNDLTFGVRTQLQTPVATAVVMATLAFGIAANVVAFALIDTFFLRPLSVRQPGRLVRIYSSSPGGMQYFTVSYGDYADMRARTGVFERVVVEEPVPLTLGVAGSYERVWGARVSHDYFAMLGVTPASGRFFTQEEEAPGAAPVAVIGHGLWRRAFGGRDVIGDTMTVQGQRVTIVGIAGERFHGTTLGLFPDLWLPVIRDPETVLARGGGRFFVLARLQPGKSVAEANAALDLLAHRLERTYATNRGVRFPVLPESHGRVHPSARGGFLGVSGVFLVVAILVLVLACTNVAAILLARGLSRRAEIAVRLALGATRGRIVRQLLIESCSVAAVAGITGIALAWMAMDVLSTMPLPTARGAPIAFAIGVDGRILSFSVLVAAVSTILFGLAPALTASRGELVPALKNEAAGAGLRSTQVRDVLIAMQVALSIVLLIAGGLFLRSLQHALRIDPGFDPDDVVVASVDLTPRSGAGAPAQFWRRLVDHLVVLPHTRAATLADRVPFEINITVMRVAPEGGAPSSDDTWPAINYAIVHEGYFETLRIPLLEGREFSRHDGASAPAVIVVNDVLARRFWPGTTAVGRRLLAADGTSYEVVGVARSLKYLTLGEEPTPYIYRPLAQTGAPTMTLIVRTAADPTSLIRELRPAVRAVDDNVAVYNIETMTDRMRLAYLPATSGAAVLTLMSIVALLLTAVGLYGTVYYAVGRRTHEIGIRRALGAQQAGIVWLVVSRVTLFAVAGLAVGAAAGLISSRALRTLLYDVDPFDHLVIAFAPIVMVSVCTIAASVPAWRAAHIDPAVALRRE